MFKIMVVEDDEKIANIICENGQKWGFDCYAVSDFYDVLSEFTRVNPELVLMDINLPSYDGFYWCGKIRQVSKVPVIFISSRNSNMDIIMAMNMGGDDYIIKPFSLEVLMAKINALIRRTYSYSEIETDLIEHGDVILNIKDNTLIYKDKIQELTRNEFKIVYLLMKNHGAIISRERIMRSLWDDESFVDDNTLTVNINRLRKKLSLIGIENFIETRKGQGYIIL